MNAAYAYQYTFRIVPSQGVTVNTRFLALQRSKVAFFTGRLVKSDFFDKKWPNYTAYVWMYALFQMSLDVCFVLRKGFGVIGFSVFTS
jgi:hypothetical protein